MTIKEAITATKAVCQWLERQDGMMERYRDYAQMFGERPGGNVFRFVLMEALSTRGFTIQQFDELRKEWNRGKCSA